MGRKIQPLGKYYQKRPWEGGMSNIHGCFGEEIFTRGKLSFLLFSLRFTFTLNYITLHSFIRLLGVPLSSYLSLVYGFSVIP